MYLDEFPKICKCQDELIRKKEAVRKNNAAILATTKFQTFIYFTWSNLDHKQREKETVIRIGSKINGLVLQ